MEREENRENATGLQEAVAMIPGINKLRLLGRPLTRRKALAGDTGMHDRNACHATDLTNPTAP